jgi:hypothetical protein
LVLVVQLVLQALVLEALTEVLLLGILQLTLVAVGVGIITLLPQVLTQCMVVAEAEVAEALRVEPVHTEKMVEATVAQVLAVEVVVGQAVKKVLHLLLTLADRAVQDMADMQVRWRRQ